MTRLTPNGHCGYEFWSNVPHPVPSRASYVEAWDRVVFLSKLVFETGCADITVRAEWAARTLSAGTHSPKTDSPFMPVSHWASLYARTHVIARNCNFDCNEGTP